MDENDDWESRKVKEEPFMESSRESQNSNNCGKFPSQNDLNITDTYWQVTTTRNGTFYLYNAYYDDRVRPPVVRILALINVIFPTVRTYCQFWYENVSEPIISEVSEYRYIWNPGWGANKAGATPYLIACVPPYPLPPKFVSLTDTTCRCANNLLEVKNKKQDNNTKEPFIISVKRLDFDDDVSLQFVEWLEIVKIFGASKVEIFVLKVHENVLKVLNFYENEGFVTVKFINYPSDLPNLKSQSWYQWTQNELICYHDTFYENLYSYDFLVPIDPDEFFMPLHTEDRTWMDLLSRTIQKSLTEKADFDAYPVENHYFLLNSKHENETAKEIPKNLYFLPNIYRADKFTPHGGNVKTFIRTDRILTIHNHFPFSCLNETNNYHCKTFQVAREDGQLSHYRSTCITNECKESMDNPVMDTSLWKFKDEILLAVNEAVQKIKTFTNESVDLRIQ